MKAFRLIMDEKWLEEMDDSGWKKWMKVECKKMDDILDEMDK